MPADVMSILFSSCEKFREDWDGTIDFCCAMKFMRTIQYWYKLGKFDTYLKDLYKHDIFEVDQDQLWRLSYTAWVQDPKGKDKICNGCMYRPEMDYLRFLK